MISAEIVARILLHQGLTLNIGDPVLAWDDDGNVCNEFRVGIFKGYDHAFSNGMRPFLVRLSKDIVHYTYIKPIPKKYLGFVTLPTTTPETPDDNLPDSLREEGVQ